MIACPRCGSVGKELSSKEAANKTVERRYCCEHGHTFTTIELHPVCVHKSRLDAFYQTMLDRWHIWARNREMHDMRESGAMLKEIAVKYKLSEQNVYMAIKAFKKGNKHDP